MITEDMEMGKKDLYSNPGLQKLAYSIMAEQGEEFHLTKPLHEYLPGERPERKGSKSGSVFVLSEDDLSRVGSCWMRGRLRIGDVCMCIKHSGDCFNDYILLQMYDNAIRGIPGSEFGAYVFYSDPLNWRPTPEEFDIIRVGGSDNRGLEKHPLTQEVEGARSGIDEPIILKAQSIPDTTVAKSLRRFLIRDLQRRISESEDDSAMNLWHSDVPLEDRVSAKTTKLRQELCELLAGFDDKG
jgi:hypothetical protein